MADAFDDEADQTITIDEYLNKVEAEELEADLVLGGDDGKECTYNMGYMKRQAIFSCLTCTPDGNAGVCTACSLACHDGHEIVELWTKRNFRCDCGNSKFGEFYCKLFTKKDVENGENSYNHNFKGLYCTCNRPYPDPDAEEQEEMIQCIMCEDWFHEEHLGLDSSSKIPRDEEGEPYYEDFICKACSGVCSFLTVYPQKIWAAGGQDVSVSKDKSVLEDTTSGCGSSSSSKDNATVDVNCESMRSEKASVMEESAEKNIVLSDCTKDDNPNSACILGESFPVSPSALEGKPLFVFKGWRDVLCRCGKCLDMYGQKGISYLLDKEDSIAEYEKMAKQKREEKLQQQEGDDLNFLNKLGHVEKMEILSGIADFKDEFRSFLESFDSSKPITSSDIHQIFDNLAKKRRRME